MLDLEPVDLLSRDLREAAKLMTAEQARYLVDSYYIIQDDRKRNASQSKALEKNEEPNDVIAWFCTQSQTLEGEIRKALHSWARIQPAGPWLYSITGIGPVISAGLMAHIDVSKSPSASHLWSYAGLNPDKKWEPKTKRPWNASLKVLCWKIGESFVKVCGNPNDYYGRFYLRRKELEQARNDQDLFRAVALEKAKLVRKTTQAYTYYIQGKLPPGHIHARAKRYATKLFLAHFHHVLYLLHYHKPPPAPYAIEHGGHVDYIQPPNLELVKP